jgi:hypothetical protein
MDRQIEACFGDIHGDGLAHGAETDKTDFEWHENIVEQPVQTAQSDEFPLAISARENDCQEAIFS